MIFCIDSSSKLPSDNEYGSSLAGSSSDSKHSFGPWTQPLDTGVSDDTYMGVGEYANENDSIGDITFNYAITALQEKAKREGFYHTAPLSFITANAGIKFPWETVAFKDVVGNKGCGYYNYNRMIVQFEKPDIDEE